MGDVVEIFTGRERRRRWSTEEKLRLVAESREPGARVRSVAARHGVRESLLFTWRRQVNEGVLIAPGQSVFIPVQVIGPACAPAGQVCSEPRHAPASSSRAAQGMMEIELGNGRQVRVGSDVNLAALRRVLVALRG